jgi:hypothetical protein
MDHCVRGLHQCGSRLYHLIIDFLRIVSFDLHCHHKSIKVSLPNSNVSPGSRNPFAGFFGLAGGVYGT